MTISPSLVLLFSSRLLFFMMRMEEMSHVSFVVPSVVNMCQGLDEADEDRKIENLYTGQGVGADEEEDEDDEEVDGTVGRANRVLQEFGLGV